MVYIKPSCVQCTATFRELDRRGLEYETADLATDKKALERADDIGYSQGPIVFTPFGDHWSGFRPDLVAELVVDLAQGEERRGEIVRRRIAQQEQRLAAEIRMEESRKAS